VVKKKNKAIIITLITAAALVTIAFITSHYLLENKAKAVLFGHSQLALLDS
jgi:hypothetical protein